MKARSKAFDALVKRYIPMTETAFYILLVLSKSLHGYGVAKAVSDLTHGRIVLGPGTIYGTLKKLNADGLIDQVDNVERRILYRRSALGDTLFALELGRVRELLRHETLWRDLESGEED